MDSKAISRILFVIGVLLCIGPLTINRFITSVDQRLRIALSAIGVLLLIISNFINRR